jgi:hypothetical protein
MAGVTKKQQPVAAVQVLADEWLRHPLLATAGGFGVSPTMPRSGASPDSIRLPTAPSWSQCLHGFARCVRSAGVETGCTAGVSPIPLYGKTLPKNGLTAIGKIRVFPARKLVRKTV